MSTQEYGEYLVEKGLDEEKAQERVEIAQKFEDFLQGRHGKGAAECQPDRQDVIDFCAFLIEEGLNNWDQILVLVSYARFLKLHELEKVSLELIDGAEAIGNLHHKVGEALGEEERDILFEGIVLPELGSDTREWPAVTQAMIERLEAKVGPKMTKDLLKDCLRYLEDSWFGEARKKYEASGGIDAFLQVKGDDFIGELKGHLAAGTLFFTQEITQDVIDFVESVPEIRQGVLEGNTLYEIKIPYMTKEYLAEEDPGMKAYYYCHCPWARESLVQEDVSVPPVFCNCSAGFHKKYWEVVLGHPLEAEVIESVLKGDPHCKIAIHLPDEVIS